MHQENHIVYCNKDGLRISWQGIPEIIDEQTQVIIPESANYLYIKIIKWLIIFLIRRLNFHLEPFYRLPDRMEITFQWASKLHDPISPVKFSRPSFASVTMITGALPPLPDSQGCWGAGQRTASFSDTMTARYGK